LVDIGAESRQSDGIFAQSNFGQRFEKDQMNLPQPRSIEASGLFVLITDEVFALTHYMMRPYLRSGRLNRQKKVNILNRKYIKNIGSQNICMYVFMYLFIIYKVFYRLSRARRIIENAFDILAAKWKIYRRPIIVSVSIAVKVIQTTVCLHNFVIENKLPLSKKRYTRIISEGETDKWCISRSKQCWQN